MANPTDTIGFTETLEFVTMNLPADDLTPSGATLLFTADQARTLAKLLNEASAVVDDGDVRNITELKSHFSH